MAVLRCKRCGCVHVEDEVICPTCGVKNRSRKMFDGPSSKQSMVDETEPLHTTKKRCEDKRRLNLFVVLFSLVALPFIVIWELQKKYSSKRTL